MSFLRCILAAFFAILIANPACCCAMGSGMGNPQGVADGTKARHSNCCDEQTPRPGDAPDHRACNCDVSPRGLNEQPRITVSSPEFVVPVLFASEAAAEDLARCNDVPAPAIAPADTGPQMRRLALFQRFLI